MRKLRFGRFLIDFYMGNQQSGFDQLVIEARLHKPGILLLILAIELPVEHSVAGKQKPARIPK